MVSFFKKLWIKIKRSAAVNYFENKKPRKFQTFSSKISAVSLKFKNIIFFRKDRLCLRFYFELDFFLLELFLRSLPVKI